MRVAGGSAWGCAQQLSGWGSGSVVVCSGGVIRSRCWAGGRPWSPLQQISGFVGDKPYRHMLLQQPTGVCPSSLTTLCCAACCRRSTSCILLTTHSMEEADLLADYVFILAEGRLAAQGTPLELKTRYGVGYTLTAVLDRSLLQQAAGQGQLGTAVRQQELQRRLAAAGLVKGGAASPDRNGSSTSLEAAAAGEAAAATPVQLSSQALQQQQQEVAEVTRPSPAAAAARLGGSSPTATGGMSRSTSASSLRAATHAVVSSAAQQLLALVAQHVSGAELVAAGAGQVAVRLPQDNRAAFPQVRSVGFKKALPQQQLEAQKVGSKKRHHSSSWRCQLGVQGEEWIHL